MKIRTHLLIALLIIVKLLVGSIVMYRFGIDSSFIESRAIASELENSGEKTENDTEEQKEIETIDLSFLVKKKNAIEKETRTIEKRKEELIVIQQDIDKKIEKLSRIRNEIMAEAAKKKTFEQKRKHLIKAYTAMKPQSAAKLIEKLDINLAIGLLSNMKGDVVGNILSYLDVEKASQVSEGLLKSEQ